MKNKSENKIGVHLSLAAIFIATLLFAVSCGGSSSSVQQKTKQSATTPQKATQYRPPAIPAMLATKEEQMEYMALNYWKNFDFRDTTTLSTNIAESAFARYIMLLKQMPREVAERGMTALMESSSRDSVMFHNFIEIGEKYLYDPNSPLRNEELYIPILEYIVTSPSLDKWSKIRPQYQLDMALKNRVGERATEFVITHADGSQSSLSKVDSKFTILLFNNPDCADCKRVKEFIIDNSAIFSRAKIVSVYVDSDLELWRATEYPKEWINGYDKGELLNTKKLYDLKAIPTLYLLDSEKRIILKDATVEAVGRYLVDQQLP